MTSMSQVFAGSPAPDGYALPKAAADLVAHATAHGWLSRVGWAADISNAPLVHVAVGRRMTPDEQEQAEDRGEYGDRWCYELTWHSRDCAPGRLRLFGRPLAHTPEQPRWHDGPSVKGIRQVIADNPAPEQGHTTAPASAGG
ncbi:hypothetical protein ACPCTO_13560 [Streptomyces olivoreticuli]